MSERYVLDAFALLRLLFVEPGAERIEAVLPRARINAANLAEVVAKLVDRGVDDAGISSGSAEHDLQVAPLDRAQAEAADLPLSDR